MEDIETNQWIRKEHLKLKADPEWSPFKTEIDRMLAIWKESSPKHYLDLKKAGLLREYAEVLQNEKDKEEQMLMKGGMPYTDARQQAEREWLDLEPEAELEEQMNQVSPAEEAWAALEAKWEEQVLEAKLEAELEEE